ncbi:MAG: sulfur carrier protein ThiS [Bacteroidales bacterium]|jgi:thiamine biosynthesis protein ThiS|nr:sulfur carrier protein ThiS [Bacteroidales bacterium]
MKILLNNREEEFEADSMTVSKMLEIRKFTFRMRIIKINGELIPRDKYESTVIHDGDNVQMLYLMSGG